MSTIGRSSEQRPAPVFIVGAWRSGTTVLRLMLNRHSRIAIPTESHFVVELYRRFRGRLDCKRFWEALRVNPFFVSWHLDEEAVGRRLQSVPECWRDQFEVVYGAYAEAHSKPRWGDKTPDYVLDLDIVHRIFPDVQVIHIVRDGRDVACSLADVPWFDEDIVGAAHGWRRCVVRGHGYGKRLGAAQYYEIRYEELMRHPPEQLESICSFLGERFEPSMLTFHEDAHEWIRAEALAWHRQTIEPANLSRIGRWRRDLSPAQVSGFEQVAGDMLARLGYETATAPAWGWQPGRAASSVARLARTLRRVPGRINARIGGAR